MDVYLTPEMDIKLPALARQVLFRDNDESEFVLIIGIKRTRTLKDIKGTILYDEHPAIKLDPPLVVHVHNIGTTKQKKSSCSLRTYDSRYRENPYCFMLCDMVNHENQLMFENLITKFVLEEL